jgi:hypothetical protein
MNEEELLVLMKTKRDEIGTKALALALGVSEPTVRSVCTGNYPGDPGNVLDKFARVFVDVVPCPYVDRTIERGECETRSRGPRPFGGASKLAWWEACQRCPHK